MVFVIRDHILIESVFSIVSELSKPIKSEQMSSTEYNNYIESAHFEECANSNPIDLSRRRDSVETRKTPSPSDSSMFGSSSPSMLNDSPSTASLNNNNNNSGSRSVGGGSSSHSAILSSARSRSDTPTHHYQSPAYMQQFRHSSAAFYPYQSKRDESPSPPDTLTAAMHHRHMHDYAGVTAAAAPNSPEEINPYILHAVALQQKLVQSQILERPSSNDSSTAANINIPATITSNSTVFPMVMGRDGKLSRPFKAYPRDPLSISASLTATDSILDRTSTEKFFAFRKQMLEQIHAANGGHPTISNPKMRRTSAKAFADNIPAGIPDADQQQQQQRERERERERELLMQQQHQQQEGQNNALSDSSSNGGGSNGKNSTHKDSAYFERRKKNNAAAKKSRDRRRIKEDEIAIRAAYFEREATELRYELEATKRQLAQFMAQSHSSMA